MSETIEKWSSLEETAEYLGVTKDTIRNWIKKADILSDGELQSGATAN